MSVPPLQQHLAARQRLARHRHDEAYVAVVLAGSYQQAGDCGRRRLVPGDVVVHGPWAAHLNHVGTQGARLLNLPGAPVAEGFGHVADIDTLARLAEREPGAAARQLAALLQPLAADRADWVDLLAADLLATPTLSITTWAQQQGLAAATVSRGFRQAFGTSPRRWRHEQQARRALQLLLGRQQPLAQAALEAGYADQAHLTHAVSALTGRPPGWWRQASSRDKTPWR